MSRRKSLKTMVDEQLSAMLETKDEPSEGRLKLLNTAIKKLALDAKLEEAEYGDFFNDNDDERRQHGHSKPGSTAGNETRAKPHAGKRANGGADPA